MNDEEEKRNIIKERVGVMFLKNKKELHELMLKIDEYLSDLLECRDIDGEKLETIINGLWKGEKWLNKNEKKIVL